MTKKKQSKKYYVIRPVKESHFDTDYRIVGTKEDLVKYLTEHGIEESIETKELNANLVEQNKPLIHIEFHSGSKDGTCGFGSSGIFKSEKEAKEWMLKYLTEANIGEIPKSFIFHIEPIYWIKFDE